LDILNEISSFTIQLREAMDKLTYCVQHVSLDEKAVARTVALLNNGATIPFIARYRKEQTGGMDELQIATIRDAVQRYDTIVARQKTISDQISEQGKLTDELEQKIISCFDLSLLEDLYLPYKQKRQTRGDKARKLGLEPLAKMIMVQRGGQLDRMSASFVKGEILDEEMAIAGACDIIAEWMNESTAARSRLRMLFERKAVLQTKLIKGKEEDGEKYADYFDFSEPLYRCPSHRFLAIHRAKNDGILSVKAQPDAQEAIEQLKRIFVKSSDELGELIGETCKDAYKRLLAPSLENELLQQAKEKADKSAIQVFATNLRQLLLAPPLGNKRILAIDPGFRTGCKIVCLNEEGSLLHNTTIFPHPPQKEWNQAQSKIVQLVESYKIDAIAIGDGTAGRETEQFIQRIRFNRELKVFSVREDGASIYSASSIARKEFPDYDVTVRGAVSIGRRLMDPLSELVKIDPKSIGVGQYQHEVHQGQLKQSLDDVVVSSVNAVGVDLNTASSYLLTYVSGLGPNLADKIVEFRKENGPFTTREELKKVPRLGEKAFEQAAGFLRVRNGKQPLDDSAVHPESYGFVEQIALKNNLSISNLLANTSVLNQLQPSDFPLIDKFTFEDVINELKKQGRDPRGNAKVLEFDDRIKSIEDLKVGMRMNGIVTNVTAFGAFVNIGLKENGLIHKSNLADYYVDDPSTVVALHDHVHVQVLEIDSARKRIGLKRLM
jgi:uncharacterized protein